MANAGGKDARPSGLNHDVETLFRLIVEAAPNAMLMIGPNRRIRLVNRRAEELFGYSREEILGEPVDMLVPPQVREKHVTDVAGYVNRPQTRAMGAGRDLYAVRKDGSEVPVEIGLNPVEHEGTTFIIVSVIDLSARREAAQRLRARTEELARANTELERSNRELDAFAYVASHDLQAPLRDIDNLAQWIREDVAESLPETSARHLALLQNRVRRMEALLDSLLHYSRAGRVFGRPERVDVDTLLSDVLELVGRPPQGFSVEIARPLPSVRTPRAPLEQIFRNLIANAIRHHDRAEGRVRISAAPRGDLVEFSVIDDGPGIPPEFHERAFAMFQTLRPRDEVEGTGMGLALVKRLVEAHGGQIELDSSVGRGATFRFTWPREWESPN